MYSEHLGTGITHSLVVLDNGFVLRIAPNTGPLGGDPTTASLIGLGHSPLTFADVEIILAGLERIDADAYNELAGSID